MPGRRLAAMLLVLAASAAGAPLEPCRLPGLEHDALCGHVARALDPADAQGPRIDVHFAVLPALARDRKPDPVFFLAGGPGQSAIELAGPVSRLLARLANRRDIVLVDQRGTGRGAPLTCAEVPAAAALGEALDPQAQVQRLRHCLATLSRAPHADLRHFGTAVAMADVDAVRRSLGAQRINLIGVSYGTRAALDYLRQFPASVRRLVLDGVAPPDMRLPQASAADNQAAFDAMLASCEREAACAARFPRLRASWQELLASLPRRVTLVQPFTGQPETLTLTRDMLLEMVRAALYQPALASALPAALSEAAEGRFAPLVGLSSARPVARGEAALAQGMHFSVICSEDMPVDRPPATGAGSAAVPDFGEGLAPLYREVCAFWPRGAVPEGFRALAPTPVAALLLSGGIDPVTPPRHGERVAAALGALARHEVVANAGHGLLALPCLRDAVFRFIDASDDAQALRVDTGCARGLPRPPAFMPIAAGLLP